MEWVSNMDLLEIIKTIKDQLIAAPLYALFLGFFIRTELAKAARLTLCKREFKERCHGRTFLEWALLTNFKDVIPKPMYIWYYIHLGSGPIFSLILLLVACNGIAHEEIINLTQLYMAILAWPALIYCFVFIKDDYKRGQSLRFIPRRHVMTQKHAQQKKGKKHTQRKNRK